MIKLFVEHARPIAVTLILTSGAVLTVLIAYTLVALDEHDRVEYLQLCQQVMKLTEPQCLFRYKELKKR